MTLIVKGGQLGWSESGYRRVDCRVFARGVSKPPDGFLGWVLWWLMGFSRGGGGATCCRPKIKNLTLTYICPGWCQQKFDPCDNFLLSFLELRWFLPSVTYCRPWPWNTTTKNSIWVNYPLKISLLPVPRCVIMWHFISVHQKRKKLFWCHEAKKWLTSFKLQLTQQPANLDVLLLWSSEATNEAPCLWCIGPLSVTLSTSC